MRRANDFYPTPEFATRDLLSRFPIEGRVFECCVGDGAISRVLAETLPVLTNDIDPAREAHLHGDATEIDFWSDAEISAGRVDWVITNPPFNQAFEIVCNAHTFARKGIAMLLRLSFLEPTEERGEWLNQNPPTDLIVTPRISFTGDGKTDNVTTAWMIWEHGRNGTISIAKNPRFTGEVKQETMVFA